MSSKKPMFSFNKAGSTVAIVQAVSKKQARERAFLISHLVGIPSDCKVSRLPRRIVRRAPVFFEGHFLAIEDALASA